MYYFYVEIEYVATNFSPARTDLAVKLLTSKGRPDDTDVGNIAILLSTPKQAQLFPLESSKIVRTEINRYKDNSLFLSPTTKKLHDSLEKASRKSQPLYTTKSLRATRTKYYSVDRSHSKS
jgi:hypothetical protein